MPDYARACRPPDYAPNYAIMPSIMARALVVGKVIICALGCWSRGPSLPSLFGRRSRRQPRRWLARAGFCRQRFWSGRHEQDKSMQCEQKIEKASRG